jgi:hypothetical protein
MPLLAYEKTVSAYVSRLTTLADPGMGRLVQVFKAVRIDEARHVAGVGMTCRALVERQKPDPFERAIVSTLCKLVIADMDRGAWWKPGLQSHMDALGLDTEAFRVDCEGVMRELDALLEGR